MAKKMNFQSSDSLNNVVIILNEVNEALKDSARTIIDSPIPEILLGAVGGVAGGGIAFGALYGAGIVGLSAPGITSGLAALGSLVGGGMVAGVFVLAAPVAVLAGTGVFVASALKRKQLKQEKERIYKEATEKYDLLLKELKRNNDISEEREKYLQSLIIILKDCIKKLEEDLDI